MVQPHSTYRAFQAVAQPNMFAQPFTLEVSQFRISLLNEVASRNMSFMAVTCDVSHRLRS